MATRKSTSVSNRSAGHATLRGLTAFDFEPAMTKQDVAEGESQYDKSWGVKRRIALYTLTRSRRQLAEAANDEKQCKGLFIAAENVREWREHLKVGVVLADAALAALPSLPRSQQRDRTMADETVTLPRETLETIQKALHAAITANVAADYLCRLSDDGLPHEAVCALKLCIAEVETQVCDSDGLLIEALGVCLMAETTITSAALRQAGIVLNELATLASKLDRECYFTHGTLIDDRDAEGVQLETAAGCEIEVNAALHRLMIDLLEERTYAEIVTLKALGYS